MNLTDQIIWLLILSIPIACISWTVTHEEIFKEPRDYCKKKSGACKSLLQRKFFYVFTCEYCFSFYVTALFLIITRFKLLYIDWRGYLIALFSLMWVANAYMSLFFKIRIDIKKEGIEAKIEDEKLTGIAEKDQRKIA